jgi:hypothetical protein
MVSDYTSPRLNHRAADGMRRDRGASRVPNLARTPSAGPDRMKNGSVLFLDAGQGLFAVTATHVVTECFADTKSPMFL